MATYLAYTFFFFNDTATTEIYTLSLHDALPISRNDSHALMSQMHLAFVHAHNALVDRIRVAGASESEVFATADRKSTRLNSSHSQISYAVFCLKKKHPPRHNARPHDTPLHAAPV